MVKEKSSCKEIDINLPVLLKYLFNSEADEGM